MATVLQSDLQTVMTRIGQDARAAAGSLALAPAARKNEALLAGAAIFRRAVDSILEANAKDMAAANQRGLTGAMLDRLALDANRVEAMARGLEAIADQPDPVGAEIARWQRPNGLDIARIRVPLGVIGIIYESRPNVTADAGALCLKAGNAAILRCGSESFHSSHAILDVLQTG
ncbi:MAG: gamma-glutamyl-phosphate reductase, partial [Pseudomonadota bacterium]